MTCTENKEPLVCGDSSSEVPPLTSEEEEQLPRDEGAEELPPQPERRPPYAVDYSAGGHSFQMLLPGDVTVVAVDGALVLRHPGFPVLGISAITPLKKEAS